jgi:hypothetical protein
MDNIIKIRFREHENIQKGKGKVVPVLFLTEHHAIKVYCRSGGIAPCIL